MKVTCPTTELRATLRPFRQAGERIALVPTMGALHDGHLSLIRQARAGADRLVVSLFVNPTQFGPGEDLDRYPRPLERDMQICRSEGVDILFTPQTEQMYCGDASTQIEESTITTGFEAASRPGHFNGVLTVVAKLFNLVQPDLAFFGWKDAQQLAAIRRMVRDLDFPVKLVAGETVREKDGLALSSRNAYLSAQQRREAPCLYQALQAARSLVLEGETGSALLKAAMKTHLDSTSAVLDYADIVNEETFEPVPEVGAGSRAVMAARFGEVRLLDNICLGSQTLDG